MKLLNLEDVTVSGVSLFCQEEKALKKIINLRSGSHPVVQRVYHTYCKGRLTLRNKRPTRARASTIDLSGPSLIQSINASVQILWLISTLMGENLSF